VVVPVYNEAGNLAALVDEVRRAVSSLDLGWELILVDDGSRDQTADLLPRLCSDQVRAIRLERNSGQSTALLVGLRASRYDMVATMDGDLQNDPKDLPGLLRQLTGADLVCGRRQQRRDTLWRRAVSRGANWLRGRLTGDGVSDTGCSLKVMTGAVADQMVFFRGAHRFMPALAQLEGFKVAEVPVSHRPRATGQTKYGNWQRLKATLPDLLGFLWLKSRYAEYRAEEISR
jgi:glycosyltransferase involved in cell wall biosynthesis